VLGTGFSVRRYATEDTVQIAVHSGKVVAAGHGTPLMITAGSVARVTDSTATATTMTVGQYTDWVQGLLVFERTPVAEMLATVSRWSGYHFRLADAVLAAEKVSVSLKLSDPSQMMAVIKGTLDVDMIFDSTVVTLTPRRDRHRQNVPNVRARHDVHEPSMEIGR
jgi:transmembrane sensor